MLEPKQEIEFQRCLAFVLEQEGGFSDDATDHGGRTNLGITESEYNAWLRETNPNGGHADVRGITHDQAKAIYLQKYWLPAHCGLLAWPANCALFDSVVNTGLNQGIKFLQRALSLPADGVCGPATQGAMARVGKVSFLRDDICHQRDTFYEGLASHPGQHVFLHGWLNRVEALRELR